MKIRLTLPKKDSPYLGHDSPLIRAIGFGILSFLLLSSLTVFIGVRSHVTTYLDDLPDYLAWVGYGIGYLIFSLAPDSLNVICIAFVARSILKGFWRDIRSLVLILVCLATSYFLTDYSYHMSQVSAEALARSITPEEEAPDIVKMDSSLQRVVSGISADFDKEYQRISAEYDTLIARSQQQFEAQKAPYRRKIASYQRSRQPTNTQWIDKQIDRQKSRIESIEAERIAEATRLTDEKRQALAELRERRTLKEDRAQVAADTAKAIVITGTNKKNTNIASITDTLVIQLSGIAGKAVFILLALAIVREILRNRNGIEPVPVFSEFDFGGNPVWETLLYLPTKFGRFILRNVRQGYEGIRTQGMPSPERPGTLYDWTTANNDIKAFEQPENDEPEDAITTAAPPTKRLAKSPKKRRQNTRKKSATTAKNKMRPIGFRTGFSENKSTADSQTTTAGADDGIETHNGPVSGTSEKVIYKEVDTSLRDCLECGETYKPRANNQKFCSRKCKDRHHRNKHNGQAFEPGIYRGKYRR